MPFSNILPAETAIRIWPKRLIRRIAGLTAFIIKSVFFVAFANSSVALCIFSELLSSWLNAFITTRPLYASSTKVVTLLTHCCRFIAYFKVFAETNFVAAKAMQVNTKKISVSRILRRNIMNSEPTTIPTAVNSFNIPVCSASAILSRSLTVWLRMVPVFVRSK